MESGAESAEPLLGKPPASPRKPYLPFGRSGIRKGTFGPASPGTEGCAVFGYSMLALGVLGAMCYTCYTYFGQHRVHVATETEAQFSAEVPSVMMCPYSKDTAFVTGPAQGAMHAIVTLASYPKEVEGWCQIVQEAGAAGEARCRGNLTEAAAAPPCCCYPQQPGSAFTKGGYVCTTNYREAHSCRGGGGRDGSADRECFCLDLSRFRLHNLQTEQGNMLRETFELRSTYNIQDLDPEGGAGDGNNAMKVGMYSNYSSGAKSFFYMEAGFFALGYLEKSIYHYVDWFKAFQYDSYSFQTTMLEESYHRGEQKCADLPPLARPENAGLGFNCTKEGCTPGLVPRPAHPSSSNFCTRISLGFSEFFIYKGISFSSIWNVWALCALVMVLMTQLNNLNLFNLVFPYRERKDERRNVSAGLYFLTCCCVRSSHEAESDHEV